MTSHTPSRPTAPLDVEATVRRARRLYTVALDEAALRAVGEVTAELRQHLASLIPLCRRLLDQTPTADESVTRTRFRGALISAECRLTRGCGAGPTQALIHMRLLAEDAAYFDQQVRRGQR